MVYGFKGEEPNQCGSGSETLIKKCQVRGLMYRVLSAVVELSCGSRQDTWHKHILTNIRQKIH
jgi:hypothetical protein